MKCSYEKCFTFKHALHYILDKRRLICKTLRQGKPFSNNNFSMFELMFQVNIYFVLFIAALENKEKLFQLLKICFPKQIKQPLGVTI